MAKRVCQPIVKDGRRQRGLNPWAEQRRQSGRVTWALARLRAHGIIKKVGGSYRYQLTPALWVTREGWPIVITLLAARQADVEKLLTLAA